VAVLDFRNGKLERFDSSKQAERILNVGNPIAVLDVLRNYAASLLPSVQPLGKPKYRFVRVYNFGRITLLWKWQESNPHKRGQLQKLNH
jgi:hypothetical protein